MDIKLELLSNSISKTISELVMRNLDRLNITADQIPDTMATTMLAEIQKIIQDETITDFDAIEMIVCLFEKYGVDAGFRHDFG